MAEDCGCTVVIRRSGVDRIDYCPLHAAAPRLILALRDFAEHGVRHDLRPRFLAERDWHAYLDDIDAYVRDEARAALAAAEGRDA